MSTQIQCGPFRRVPAVPGGGFLRVSVAAAAQSPTPDKWAPGEFSKWRREIYDHVYDRVAYLGPYAKWLMEEVGTIITSDEQAEFEALGSDPARNVFIEKVLGQARREIQGGVLRTSENSDVALGSSRQPWIPV